uniref:regulatory protein RecX n=1 Tax=Thaumasiovibrio occultus TaxID=1891184 RepID=UPI000B354137|nr:regulatory protein RecX [Thaumasiovibrio occultus]
MTVSAYQAAVAILSRRDYAEQELRSKLIGKGYSIAEVNGAIAQCLSYGYLNDDRYARLVLQNSLHKGWGPLRIQQHLRQKGISDSQLHILLMETHIDWFEHAVEVAERKFGSKIKLPKDRLLQQKEKARRYRFLQYRGFSGDQIHYALEQLLRHTKAA